ncbi:restriction endonuclease subunit S [Chryseobacterium gambrini]|uniref:restriction endonuclease subunit S n=1 Tax=Chryseobacterium gambrini TaxID=373672 RepID=UPI0022F37F9F|nr:restriction endonuclease subunit S [Chryseobacterium gambrini]WBX98504.1 restriction endonuclease subunit S [Chryseobacterium gambrini]
MRFKNTNGNNFSEWKTKKLKKMLSIPDKIKPTFIDKNKLITVKLHLQGVLKNENTETLSIGATNYLVRKKGQFIYGKQNLFNGAFGIIPNELDGFLSSGDVPSLDIDHLKINALFLLNFLGRKHFYKQLENIATGSGSKRIHEETLLNIEIEIPSIEEQEKISNLFSAIDSKINIEIAFLKKLKSQKIYLLDNLFI